MPFFFSYKTFARLSAAAVAFSTNAIPGEPITMSPDILSCFGSFGRTPPGGRGGNGVRPEAFASHKGTQASDGFAEDQILHLIRAFVGVEGFGIREEACDVVVGDNAIAAEEFTSPRDGLARLCRAERLGQ